MANANHLALTAQVRIVKAIQDLTSAITGKVKCKLQGQSDDIKRLTDVLKVGQKMPIALTGDGSTSRVHKNNDKKVPKWV